MIIDERDGFHVFRKGQTRPFTYDKLMYPIRIPPWDSGSRSYDNTPAGRNARQGDNMDTNTILIILVVLLVLGGGGFFYKRRA